MAVLRGLKAYISTGFCPLPHRRLSALSGPDPDLNNALAPALLTFTTGSTEAEAFPFVNRAGQVDLNGLAVVSVELRDPPADPRHNAKVDRRILIAQLHRSARGP